MAILGFVAYAHYAAIRKAHTPRALYFEKKRRNGIVRPHKGPDAPVKRSLRDHGAAVVGTKLASVDFAGNFPALQLGFKIAQVGRDKIVGPRPQRRLIGTVRPPIAADFRFVIAGEQALAFSPERHRVGAEFPFEKRPRLLAPRRLEPLEFGASVAPILRLTIGTHGRVVRFVRQHGAGSPERR